MTKTLPGFNTLVYHKRLRAADFEELYSDIKIGSGNGIINVHTLYENSMKKGLKIVLASGGSSITWILKSYCYMKHQRPNWMHFVEAKIAPKTLTGTHDNGSTENFDFANLLERSYSERASVVSKVPSFCTLQGYNLLEICYYVDFDLRKLGIDCDPELLIELVRQSNPPPFYSEWIHCAPPSPGENDSGLRLVCNSVDINCYLEQWQAVGGSDDPINIIRFEVQCKYPKVYLLRKTLGGLLSDEVSSSIIDGYFKRVIMGGDYYSLMAARKLVRSRDFKEKKENRLIDALELISDHCGVTRTKAHINNADEDIMLFNRSLRELSMLGINPVTIPKSYDGVTRIPNLLDTFYAMSGFDKPQDVVLKKSLRLRDMKERNEGDGEPPPEDADVRVGA